jgi:hypothetical protein
MPVWKLKASVFSAETATRTYAVNCFRHIRCENGCRTERYDQRTDLLSKVLQPSTIAN